MEKVVVVGPGRIGTALALCFKHGGHRVLAAIARDNGTESGSSLRFSQLVNSPVLSMNNSFAFIKQADIVLITVPDKAVTSVARTLVDHQWLRTGQTVVHTAGAYTSDILSVVDGTGVRKLCMHPLQSISDPGLALERLQGATFTIEGDEEAVLDASRWVRGFGGIPVRMNPEMRPKYHAAAVLVSNAIVALLDQAAEIAGLPGGVHSFIPLIKGTIDNVESQGLEKALTGPIERGDLATVIHHLRTLHGNSTATSIYVTLGQAIVHLACRKGSLTSEQRAEFQRLFIEWNMNQSGGMSNETTSHSSDIIKDEANRTEDRNDDSV